MDSYTCAHGIEAQHKTKYLLSLCFCSGFELCSSCAFCVSVCIMSIAWHRLYHRAWMVWAFIVFCQHYIWSIERIYLQSPHAWRQHLVYTVIAWLCVAVCVYAQCPKLIDGTIVNGYSVFGGVALSIAPPLIMNCIVNRQTSARDMDAFTVCTCVVNAQRASFRLLSPVTQNEMGLFVKITINGII